MFCDWINDVDYLKRHLLCDATLQVLEKRLEESRAVIFVESENSMSSIWCKYELNYCSELGRPIYVICKNDIENSMFELKLIENKWFKDENYKRLALLKGLDIESDS